MKFSELYQTLIEQAEVTENRLAKSVNAINHDTFKYMILDGGDGTGAIIIRNQKNRFFGIQVETSDVGMKIVKDLKFKSLGNVQSSVKEFEKNGMTKLERTSEIGRFMLGFLRNTNQMVAGFGGNKVRLMTVPAVLYLATFYKSLQVLIMPHLGGAAVSAIYDKNRELYIKRSGAWLEIVNDID